MRAKERKTRKLRGVGLVFGFCKGLVVVLRGRGCDMIRIHKTKIYANLDQLRWYIDDNWGFKGFKKVGKKVKILF